MPPLLMARQPAACCCRRQLYCTANFRSCVGECSRCPPPLLQPPAARLAERTPRLVDPRPADMQQYFPAATPQAIDLLERLLTFDQGGWGAGEGEEGRRGCGCGLGGWRPLNNTHPLWLWPLRCGSLLVIFVLAYVLSAGDWRWRRHWAHPPHLHTTTTHPPAHPPPPLPAAKRLTVDQALAHPWLASLHDPADEPSCMQVRGVGGGCNQGWVGVWVGLVAGSSVPSAALCFSRCTSPQSTTEHYPD